MNRFGLFVGQGALDVLICANLHINSSAYNVGFASGGDTLGVVMSNINFFNAHKLTHMIFACRSSGGTIAALTTYAQGLGVSPIIVSASYPPNPRLAAMICNHIP